MTLSSLILQNIIHNPRITHLYREDIAPCLGCLACADGGVCPIPDAMPKLLAELAGADLILVTSPLHFTSLTAPVIAFFSRLQPFWQMRKRGRQLLPVRRRLAALAVTGGGEYPNMFQPARSVAAAAFNSLDLEFVGMVTAANTDTLPVEKNPCAMAEVEKLRKILACL